MSKNNDTEPKFAPVIEDVEVVTVSADGEERPANVPEEPQTSTQTSKETKSPRVPKSPKQTKKTADNEKPRIPYERKRRLYGYGFVALWAVGTVLLFVIPVIKSLISSLTENGAWNGFAGYIGAFSENSELVNTLFRSIPRAFAIMLFSLFAAVILNRKFRGRKIARAVFVLPVLIAASPVFSVVKASMTERGLLNAELFGVGLTGGFLELIGIAPRFAEPIRAFSENVLSVVWNSGVQILLFLAALKNIPPSSREAADIEGATPWVYFWKVTVPSVSPMILAGFGYTFIDDFISPDNALMRRVLSMQTEGDVGGAAAAAWIYFAATAAVIAIIALVTSRFAVRGGGEISDKQTNTEPTELRASITQAVKSLRHCSPAERGLYTDVLLRGIRRGAWVVFRFVLLLGLAFAALYPFVYMTLSSLKSQANTALVLPNAVNFENFRNALPDYSKALGNTIRISIISSVLSVAACALTGYGFARFGFRGKRVLLAVVMLQALMPPQIYSAQLCEMFGKLPIHSEFSMYIPAFFGNGIRAGLLIMLFRQFFRTLPKELEDAAYLEGCAMPRTFVCLILPSAANVMLTGFLFSLIRYWSEFYVSSLLLPNGQTLALKAAGFAGVGGIPLAEAWCVLAVLPIVIVYILGHKWFVEGLELAGVVDNG